MRLSEILDLPREERSRYLAAMPLTREYVFGCLDQCHVQFVKRTITRNGGVYRAEYATPGVAFVATFRSFRGMRKCTLDLIHWQNVGEAVSALLLDETFARFSPVPALEFEVVNAIHPGPVRTSRPRHPVRG